MLIQVYVKNEPLVKCDLLIAKEDAVMSIPVTDLKAVQENRMEIRLVKPFENLAMKAAVYAAEAIASAEAVSSPVFIACADKAILDGMCSMEYAGPAGGPIKCVPSGTKPQAPPKVRNRAKPKTPAQAAGDAAKAAKTDEQKAALSGTAGPAAGGTEPPAQDGDGKQGAETAAPPEESMRTLMDDPELVKNGEAVLDAPEPEPGPSADPTLDNTRKIMSILKEKGVPSGQIPGVLEALREAMDAQITLPMQVKLKLAKDGATGDMDPEETAKLVAPAFDELKALLKEIDDHNAGK